jgi:hypothetical protein
MRLNDTCVATVRGNGQQEVPRQAHDVVTD